MSAIGGPNIVEDGLVLALDAANNFRSFASDTLNVEYLIVAGGGGGSGNQYDDGGGGGAGGLIINSTKITSQNYTIVVGSGGVKSSGGAGGDGQNSTAFGFTAFGGGGGGPHRLPGRPGGSGGGGLGSFVGDNRNVDGGNATQPGSPSGGFGNKGGTGGLNGVIVNGGGYPGSGGGGGAGNEGKFPIGSGDFQGGDGGDGILLNINGVFTYYAGGGGGVRHGKGGLGGGGSASRGRGGEPAENGSPNTGGGGGGGRIWSGDPSETGIPGNGGSGIVIVRYRGPQKAGGGTITQFNGWTIHTFTSSGTFTVGSFIGDMSGNGNNGELVNGPTFDSGNLGSIQFDGVDDYVVTQSPGSYSDYTFMFFCKWNASVGFSNRIFGLSNFGTYTIYSPTNVGFHYNPLGLSPPSVTLFSNVNIGFGNWCHISVTVNSSNNLVTIYINGVSRNSSSVLPAGNFSGNIFLGAQNTASGLVSNCNIGVFTLYNRALTPQEILQNYNATKGRYGL